MSNFNLLTDSFIYNATSITGTQRIVSASELDTLLINECDTLTISGSFINLFIDLGAQKSIKYLSYNISPLNTSGISIKYGREVDDLVEGALLTSSGTVQVIPSTSGYTYPRYFSLYHVVSGTQVISISGIEVLNSETELDFGADGTLDSVTLVGTPEGGESEVVEVIIKNNSDITSDIFVSVDNTTSGTTIIDNFAIATAESGEFKTYIDELTIPDSIPWEWGLFSNTTVTSDNKLKIADEVPLPNFSVGTVDTILYEPVSSRTSLTHTERAYDRNGNSCIVRINTDHRFTFIDPIRDTRTFSTYPPYTVSGTNEQKYTHPAWDGGNKIYYLNGKDTKRIYQYNIQEDTYEVFTTMASSYNRLSRACAIYDNYLYIAGGQATAGSSSDVGTEFWRVNLTTKAEEQLTNLPLTPSGSCGPKVCALDNYIYYFDGRSGVASIPFYRYNIDYNTWEQLQNMLSYNPRDLIPNPLENRILVPDGSSNKSVSAYNILSNTWSEDVFYTYLVAQNGYNDCGLGVVENMFYFSPLSDSSPTRVLILNTLEQPAVDLSFSGYWISPILNINAEENYGKILLDLEDQNNIYVKYDTSIAANNFQIRGSNSPPSAQNSYQLFDSGLDSEEFVSNTLGDTDIVVSGNSLVFSHVSGTATYTSAYASFGFPFNSSGYMQYKFWWNPPTNRKAGSTRKSRFYIVPFLDELGVGVQPSRDPDTLYRTGGNYLVISIGADTDTGGSYTTLNFYNGTGSTVSYVIGTVAAGMFYPVSFLLNWETGAYKLYFNGNLVTTGTVSQATLNTMRPEHTYEFLSIGEQTTFEESFRYLTVSRVGLEPTEQTVSGTPVHMEDPLFGTTGSVKWNPVTVNSPIFPRYKYIQLKVTLKGRGSQNMPVLNGIKVPYVLKLSDIAPSGTGSIFVKYNFPATNDLNTNTLYLRAWTHTDKS